MAPKIPASDPSALILIRSNGMGEAPAPLQQKLLHTYLSLLDQSGMLPGAIGFYADGVKLVVEGSPVLDVLKSLEARGVTLIICSTCLNYFHLAEKVQVGVVGGMTDIIAAQWTAAKVITL